MQIYTKNYTSAKFSLNKFAKICGGQCGEYQGQFADLDVNSNKLGATVIKRNEKLVKFLRGIASMKLYNVIVPFRSGR